MTLVTLSLLGYVLVKFAIGAWVSRRMATEADYILAGRNLGAVLVTFSVFSTFFGAEAIVASAGAVYEQGLGGAWVDPFSYGVALLVVGLCLATPLWRRGLTTFADLFRERYSPGVEKLVVVMLLPGSIFWAAAQVRAFGQVLSSHSNLDLATAITVAAVLIAAYAVVGGLLADAITDLIYSIILIAGLVILGAVVVNAAGGLGQAVASVSPERLPALPGSDDILRRIEEFIVPLCGTVVAVELISRFLGSRNAGVALTGTSGGAAVYLAVGAIPVFLGLVGPSLVPDLADAEQIVPKLAELYLPPALSIVFVGAIVSAILSTVHAALHAPAAQVSHNIVVRMIPGIGAHAKLWAVRLTVMGLSVVAYLLALTSDRIHDLVETASAFGSAGVFVVALFALFTRFGGVGSAYASLSAGMLVWLVARFALDFEAPYLTALAAALTAYVGMAVIERRSA